jgi:hypothetical protein
MAEKPQPYYGAWINRQRTLLPELDEELDPLTNKLEHLIVILDTLGLEAFVAPPSRGRGRPPDDRPAIARSFVAKAVLTIPTTSALIERLQIDRALRRICGWERRSDVPSEATFSRAFAAHGLPERVHEQLVRRHLQDRIIGHLARDATEIEAREKPHRRALDDPPAPPKRKRGRPRKDEVLPLKPLTRIEQQRTQSLDEMRARCRPSAMSASNATARGSRRPGSATSCISIPPMESSPSRRSSPPLPPMTARSPSRSPGPPSGASCGSTTSWIPRTTPSPSSMIAAPRTAFR